ncbi:hypothetical protein [Blautia wexlerae]|uniref:hypothetical protein n=2 Tax=Blautia wexlerae TaxID=418240 RepID=UPI003218FB47
MKDLELPEIQVLILSGGYVTFVDSDDWIEEDTYRYMLEVAFRTGAEIVGCASVVDYEDGTQVRNYADISEGFLDRNTCIIDILGQTRHAWGAVHNKVFKKSIFDNIRFPKVRHLEDYVVTIKAFNEVNMIYFCSHSFYHHTSLPNSLSHSSWYPGRLAIPETGEQIVNYLKNNNADTVVRKYTYRFMYLLYAGVLWSIYKSKPDDARTIRANIRWRSLNVCREYLLHGPKQRGDIKMLLQFILSII